MKDSTIEKQQKILLLIAAIGLFPIALSYGLVPEISLGYLYNISVTEVNHMHIFRAVMGLYLAMIIFWLMGAFKPHLRQTAVYSLIVFMFGLAAGRMISLLLDGVPNWLLIVYLVLEILLGVLGVMVLKKRNH